MNKSKASESWPFLLVGMTGFEPATTRPPDVYATGLRYIPIFCKGINRTLFCQSETMNIRLALDHFSVNIFNMYVPDMTSESSMR